MPGGGRVAGHPPAGLVCGGVGDGESVVWGGGAAGSARRPGLGPVARPRHAGGGGRGWGVGGWHGGREAARPGGAPSPQVGGVPPPAQERWAGWTDSMLRG